MLITDDNALDLPGHRVMPASPAYRWHYQGVWQIASGASSGLSPFISCILPECLPQCTHDATKTFKGLIQDTDAAASLFLQNANKATQSHGTDRRRYSSICVVCRPKRRCEETSPRDRAMTDGAKPVRSHSYESLFSVLSKRKALQPCPMPFVPVDHGTESPNHSDCSNVVGQHAYQAHCVRALLFALLILCVRTEARVAPPTTQSRLDAET